ncbi:MAG: type II toxin-antitoxin system VapC family toxin [Deltaproteobacteria bacterium]
MNLVDSCGWLEYFADGPNANFFAPAINDLDNLIVPTIYILEVFKKVFQQRDEDSALKAVALMEQGRVVDLNDTLAMNTAKLSLDNKLPMADGIILATAHAHNSVIWTQDADFKGIRGVKYIEKKKK